MCGITGYYQLDNSPIQQIDVVKQMLLKQRHRGPDDSGIRAFSFRTGKSEEIAPEAADITNGFEGVLGFNRLSILDLSTNGHQPMCSPDGKVILIFNGEIYNAFDFKPMLEADGVKFKSHSDTEVILYLYLKFGIDEMLKKLNGMFALAITDLRLNMQFVARDRFGIKPLYFVYDKVFAFSSEIKSFFAIPSFKPKFNHEKLDEYLLFRSSIAGTLFKNVESLEPGHYLTFSPDGDLKKKRFFNINDLHRKASNHNERDQQQLLQDVLLASVKSQMISDVKLGCQLSGGIDSSLVTLLAKSVLGKDVLETVSIIFKEKNFSEEQYIDHVSSQLRLTSHKFTLEEDYYINHLNTVTWHLESPINHPNTIGIFLLAKSAREHVTVLLSGEGADEVFGGYARFDEVERPYLPLRLLRQFKKNLSRPSSILDYFDEANRAIFANAFMTPDLAQMLMPSFNVERAVEPRRSLYNSLAGSRFDKQVKLEMTTYLPDLLIRQDKMSMAHSIENRVPFLDNNVVDHSFTIPTRLLNKAQDLRAGTQKYLLKQLAAQSFGHDFAYRPKMGFGIPLRTFFAGKQFSQRLNEEILPPLRSRQIMNDRYVHNWIENIDTISHRELEALWIAVSLELWMKEFSL